MPPENYFGVNLEEAYKKRTTLYSEQEMVEAINRVSESKEQIKLVNWAKKQRERCLELRWLHHIPNGGDRNIRVASKLKLEGVESGVFDLFLPVARWKKHGLYIEMKYGNNKLSKKQQEFKQFVIEQGYATAICYNSEQGIKCLKKYLGLK